MSRLSSIAVVTVAGLGLSALVVAPSASAALSRPAFWIDASRTLTSTVPLKVAWTASTECTAVLQHKLFGSGGNWTTIDTASSRGSRTLLVDAAPNVTRQYRILDGGCNGLPATAAFSPRFVPRVQDNGSAGTFSGPTQVTAAPAYRGGTTVGWLGCAGTYTQTVSAYGWAWVHSGGPWDGTVNGYQDGFWHSAVQMYAERRYFRRIAHVLPWNKPTPTHVTLAGAGHEFCDLDAVIVLEAARR